MSILQSMPYGNGVIVPLVYGNSGGSISYATPQKFLAANLLFWHDLCFISRR
jgi:hypothetical protein